MAIGEYRGVNNVARKVAEEYRGVDNVARKITKQYRGVANVARKFFDSIPDGWRKTWWTYGTNSTVDDYDISFNDGAIEIYLKTTSVQQDSMENGTACAQYYSDVDLGGKVLKVTYSYDIYTTGHGLFVICYRDSDCEEKTTHWFYETSGNTITETIPNGTNYIDFRIDQSAAGTLESKLIITQLTLDGESII